MANDKNGKCKTANDAFDRTFRGSCQAGAEMSRYAFRECVVYQTHTSITTVVASGVEKRPLSFRERPKTRAKVHEIHLDHCATSFLYFSCTFPCQWPSLGTPSSAMGALLAATPMPTRAVYCICVASRSRLRDADLRRTVAGRRGSRRS